MRFNPEYKSRYWFNLSSPIWKVRRRRRPDGYLPMATYVRIWNVFNRRAVEFHQWGVGIVQIGNRHLAYIGRVNDYEDGVQWHWSFLFINRTP